MFVALWREGAVANRVTSTGLSSRRGGGGLAGQGLVRRQGWLGKVEVEDCGAAGASQVVSGRW